MASTLDRKVAEAAEAFVEELRARLVHVAEPERLDGARLGTQAADWAASALEAPGTSLLARRIGPVYTITDLARWLTAPGGDPLTGEAVRKRALKRRLVALRADDGHWAFPSWQFSRAAGRLVPLAEVIALWRRLPHDGFLTDADLAAWMHTRLGSLDDTPAGYANRHGADAPPLGAAVSRLGARVA
ncbi:MAG: hypothetical protein WD250_13760 [Egibacteraceae bacterium]